MDNNEPWIVTPNKHNRMIEDVTTDFNRLTHLLENGVLGYQDYRKGVLMNANKLIGFLREERRPQT